MSEEIKLQQIVFSGCKFARENIEICTMSKVVRLRPHQAASILDKAIQDGRIDRFMKENVLNGRSIMLCYNGCELVRQDDTISHPFWLEGYAKSGDDVKDDLVYYGVRPDEYVTIRREL